jgi:DNA-binding CsgD family transcriptional regulator
MWSQPWPLVGRSTELTLVKNLLDSDKRGVILVGAAGVGKTRIALECLNLATDEGFFVVQVAATEALSTLPLGQFATLMPELSPGTPRTEALRQVASAIKGRGGDRRIALLVDDIHLLDEASAALTLQLAANGDVFLIATMRSAERSSEAVVSLWKNEVVTRIDLRPLDPETTGSLLERILGAPVESPARRQLLDRSAGNMLFLRELVTTAVEAGVLVREGGLWHLDGDLTPSIRLVELVEGRLSQLREDERRALEILAVGEPVSVGLFEQLVTPATMQTLERRHLLIGHRDGRRLDLRLVHPLYSEALRAALAPAKKRSVYRMLADALEPFAARRQGDLLNLAIWRLQGGGNIEPGAMLKAAHRAWMLHDFALARELATAAARAGGGFDAELLNAQLLGCSGDPQQAESIMAALLPEAADDDRKDRLATARIENLCYHLFQPEQAALIAEQADSTILNPTYKKELTAFRATLVDTRTDAALSAVTELSEHTTGRAQAWACLYAASGNARIGKFSEALRAADRGFAMHSALAEPGLPFGPDLHTAVRAWVFALRGDLADADAAATQALARGEWLSGWALAVVHLCQGRPTTAARLGRETAMIAQRHGQSMVRKVALVQLMEAQALAGQVAAAEETLAVLRGDWLTSIRVFEADVERVNGWVEVVRGDRARARAYFTAAISLAADSGEKVMESHAIHDLARLDAGHAPLERLCQLAAGIEGPLVQARLAHVSAKATSAPAALMAVSTQFEQLGYTVLAAEAATDAACAWGRNGASRQATFAARRAEELASQCDAVAIPALDAVADASTILAPRQLEIAALAAKGMSNKDIAGRLGLSYRTIENRLHEAYLALGINGREDLARALEKLVQPGRPT